MTKVRDKKNAIAERAISLLLAGVLTDPSRHQYLMEYLRKLLFSRTWFFSPRRNQFCTRKWQRKIYLSREIKCAYSLKLYEDKSTRPCPCCNEGDNVKMPTTAYHGDLVRCHSPILWQLHSMHIQVSYTNRYSFSVFKSPFDYWKTKCMKYSMK